MRLLVLILALLATSVPAASAKGTLSLSPDPPSVGQSNVLTGCGLKASSYTEVYFRWNEQFRHDWSNGTFRSTTTDATGCFSITWTPPVVGLYLIHVEQVHNGRDQSRGTKILFEVLS